MGDYDKLYQYHFYNQSLIFFYYFLLVVFIEKLTQGKFQSTLKTEQKKMLKKEEALHLETLFLEVEILIMNLAHQIQCGEHLLKL